MAAYGAQPRQPVIPTGVEVPHGDARLLGIINLCHPDRSVAIGFINRKAEWRDLLFALATRNHSYKLKASLNWVVQQ